MEVWFWIFIAYLVLNFLCLISMIFFERKTISSVISWISVLTFVPILGFFAYIIFGSGLSYRVKRMISRHKLYEVEYNKEIVEQIQGNPASLKELEDVQGVARCCYGYGGMLCPQNEVKIFYWGQDKLEALCADLEAAEKSINMEYYIFADDATGKRVMNILIKKARQGVKVRFIYDSGGCVKAPRRFFRKLRKAGGEVGEFFPPFARIRLINLKTNYRNHKKIVVIDGKIAYTGGINIRDDHMGLRKKLSPWRDTHIRIEGTGVYPLQNIFLNDWRYVKKENLPAKAYLQEGLFPTQTAKGDAYLQVLSSGPDSQIQTIKEVFMKMITGAKKSILIQTPYFVPDEAFISSLRIAIASGVRVKIMVPHKPDHRTVFWATLSYLKEFAALGADIYLYDGFLHSKVIVVDDTLLSIGTCNLDNRSFGLNFEDTVILYSKKLNAQYRKQYAEDLNHCAVADVVYFKRKRLLNKFAQAIFRLFAPVF